MSLEKRLKRSFKNANLGQAFEEYLVPPSHLVAEPTPTDEPGTSRRQFIAQALAASGGLALAVSFGNNNSLVARTTPGNFGNEFGNVTFSPNAYVNIEPNGTVRLIAMHDEMGQGHHRTARHDHPAGSRFRRG